MNSVSYSEKYVNGIIALNNLFCVSDENVFDVQENIDGMSILKLLNSTI